MIPCVNAVNCRGPVWCPLPAGPRVAGGGWRGGLSMCVYIYVLPHPNCAPILGCCTLCCLLVWPWTAEDPLPGVGLGGLVFCWEGASQPLVMGSNDPVGSDAGAPRGLASAALLGLRSTDCGQLDLGWLAASLRGLVGHEVFLLPNALDAVHWGTARG